MTIYTQPDLYELAFSHRDIEAETAFILEAAAELSPLKIKSVLELGAGHAPHAGEFAGRDIAYLGLELHPAMLAYAWDRWKDFPAIHFQQGDMNKFEITEPVDLAMVMLGSLYYQTTEELLTHLRCVARALRTGGIYVMDSCVQYADPLSLRGEQEFVRETEVGVINSKFEIELIDASKQLYKEDWRISLRTPEGTIREVETTEYNRALYPAEFKLLVDLVPEFEIAAQYGSWNLANPIRPGSAITRPVIILRKRPSRISPAV